MFLCGASCFWRNVCQRALLLQSLHPPPPPPHPQHWKIYGFAPAFRHCSFCKTLYLKRLTVFWIHICLNNCSIICTITLCYVLHRHIKNSFSGICQHIQSYSALLRHIHIEHSQPCHILSPGIFRLGGLLKTLWNVDQVYSEPCHEALFSHIQARSEPCAMLAYAETWHIQNPGIFRTYP